jgi:hypothetical protein
MWLIVRRFSPDSRLIRLSGEGVQYNKHQYDNFNPATHLSFHSTTTMPPKSRDIEERITKASQAMDEDPSLKAARAAAKFGAPHQRLLALPQASLEVDLTKNSPHLKTIHSKSILLCSNIPAVEPISRKYMQLLEGSCFGRQGILKYQYLSGGPRLGYPIRLISLNRLRKSLYPQNG